MLFLPYFTVNTIQSNYAVLTLPYNKHAVKGKDPKFTWEILGIYRAPNDDMRVMEMLAARTSYSGNPTKRSIIGGT